MATYTETLDEIRRKILVDYQNFWNVNGRPNVDISPGSRCYVQATVMASSLTGNYNGMEFVKNELSPLTCSTDKLNKDAAIVIPPGRNPGESDVSLQSRLLQYYRYPLAGGNMYDYIKWAKETGFDKTKTLISYADYPVWNTTTRYVFGDVVRPATHESIFLYMCIAPGSAEGTVEPAIWPEIIGTQCQDDQGATFVCWADSTFHENVETCFYNNANPPVRGAGTIDLCITGNYADAILPALRGFPSQVLLATTKTYIESVRALTNYDIGIFAPSNVPVDIAVEASDASPDKCTLVRNAIIGYMRNLTVGKTLTRSMLIYIIISNGITEFSLTISGTALLLEYPVACGEDDPGIYERVWPYNSSFTLLPITDNYTVTVIPS